MLAPTDLESCRCRSAGFVEARQADTMIVGAFGSFSGTVRLLVSLRCAR